VNFYEEAYKVEKEEEPTVKQLNAFDLISFSSGLNLSGLFEDSCNPADDGERFISAEPPEKIVEKIEEFAKANENNSRVRWKKEWGVELEGRNGNVAIGVDVYQLTDGLVVVEAKRKGGDAGSYKDMWKNKLRPLLINGQTSQP